MIPGKYMALEMKKSLQRHSLHNLRSGNNKLLTTNILRIIFSLLTRYEFNST